MAWLLLLLISANSLIKGIRERSIFTVDSVKLSWINININFRITFGDLFDFTSFLTLSFDWIYKKVRKFVKLIPQFITLNWLNPMGTVNQKCFAAFLSITLFKLNYKHKCKFKIENICFEVKKIFYKSF